MSDSSTPTNEAAGGASATTPEPSPGSLLGLARDNLVSVIGTLVIALGATFVGLWADVPRWALLIAIAAGLVGCVLALRWLRGPAEAWRSALATRAASLGACLVVALGALSTGALTSTAVDPDHPATLLVLDTSAAMNRPLSHEQTGTILDAAADRISVHATDLGERQLGLATLGVEDCASSEPLEVEVEISKDAADDVKDAALDVARDGGAGQSNIVSAARNALTRLDEFRGDKRVILVVGAVDNCGRDLADVIDDTGADATTLVTWDVVGLGLPDADKEALASLEQDGVSVQTADDHQELDEVMGFLLYEKEVREEFDALNTYVGTETRLPINDAIAALSDRDPQSVSTHLETVEAITGEGEERFAALLSGDSAAAFAPVKTLLREQFDRQVAGVEVIARIRDFDADHPGTLDDAQVEERRALLGELDEIVTAYNDAVNDLDDISQSVLDELFA